MLGNGLALDISRRIVYCEASFCGGWALLPVPSLGSLQALVTMSPLLSALFALIAWLFTPSDYAICSTDHAIYTVDHTRPTVQCIRVHGSRIVSTGSLGNVSFHLLSRALLLTTIRPRQTPRLVLWTWRQCLHPQARIYCRAWTSRSVPSRQPLTILIPIRADAHAHILEWGFMKQLQLHEATSIDGENLPTHVYYRSLTPTTRHRTQRQGVYHRSPRRAERYVAMDPRHGVGSDQMARRRISQRSMSLSCVRHPVYRPFLVRLGQRSSPSTQAHRATPCRRSRLLGLPESTRSDGSSPR
jgi:hypothetical protein